MQQTKKRIQLSFLVKRTNRLLLFSLSLTVIILAIFHLFGMNQVAMQGYVLTKEIQKKHAIYQELEKIEAQVNQLETKDFITQGSETSFMVYSSQREFLVYKEKYTAQK